MTSKISASATPKTTTYSMGIYARSAVSRMLEDDALDDVGDVLAAVGGVLEVLVDLLPLDDGDRVALFLEELRHRGTEDLVGLVLHAVDVDAALDDGVGVTHVAQAAQRPLHLLGRA